jgi:hypothetical protein
MKIFHQFVILISLIGLITAFSACIDLFQGRVVETSFSSYYDYQIWIQSSAPVYNLTLYLPLPIQNGTPKIGTLLFTAETFSNNSYVRSSLPSNFHSAIEDVNGIPYLKITADAMIQDLEYNFEYREVIHTPAYTYLVNTRYPLGNESLFSPKFNLSEYTHVPAAVNYSTLIYADYRMEGSGTLVIMDGLMGSNWWYLTSDASIGNNYSDDISLRIYDESHGWQKVKGKMTVGNGEYLD